MSIILWLWKIAASCRRTQSKRCAMAYGMEKFRTPAGNESSWTKNGTRSDKNSDIAFSFASQIERTRVKRVHRPGALVRDPRPPTPARPVL
jgi:hypothetical protein